MTSATRRLSGKAGLRGSLKSVAVGVGLLAIVSSVAACGGGSASGGAASPTWITARLTGDSVILAVNEIKQYRMTHFKLGRQAGELAFMAYEYGGRINVRPSVCPPCRSQSFTLQKNILVCDSCGTVFDAKTGAGVRGACVNYPKASVSYQVNDGSLMLRTSDLMAAYQETLKPG